MTNTLAKNQVNVLQTVGIEELVKSFLSCRKLTTIEAYKRDLEEFRDFIKVESLDLAARHLISLQQGPANALVLSYKIYLTDDLKLQSATVNRRLAALRSFVKLARTLGLVAWELEIQNVPHQSYRDVRGIGNEGVRAIFKYLESRPDNKSVRDCAIFHLLFDIGLRRNEVCSIDLADLNLNEATVSILGKGKTQKQFVTLPQPTIDALKRWLEVRGLQDGPLFFRLDKARSSDLKRLTGTGLYSIIKNLGRKVGIKRITVHCLRHDAINTALKVAAEHNIGLDDVRKFSRHSDIKTLLIYKDEIENAQAKIASLVAGKIE
ncbi:MAG: hypothetical protein A4S09_04915 [Proteobacteria bacterium SG_bin7]|nr:MAG: hypothetical protein A4S09_04915 [Proteobacteria bacterium SG_bin7]